MGRRSWMATVAIAVVITACTPRAGDHVHPGRADYLNAALRVRVEELKRAVAAIRERMNK